MNAIRAGDCDSAIVASANWIADPGVQIALDSRYSEEIHFLHFLSVHSYVATESC